MFAWLEGQCSIGRAALHRLSLMTGMLFVALAVMSPDIANADDFGKLKSRLKKAVAIANGEDIRSTIVELGATGDPKAAELIFRVLPAITPEDYLDDIVGAIASIGSEKLDSVMHETLGKSNIDPSVPALAVLVAQKINDQRSLEWLLFALESDVDLVFRNARDVLIEIRSKPAIPKLIELLDNAKPRTIRFYGIRRGLIMLTGEVFDSIQDWKAYWETSGPTFDPKNIDQEEGKTKVRRKKIDVDSPGFFGVEIPSKRVMYVIDCSGSMQLWDEGEEETDAPRGRNTPHWKVRQRIERVKHQLAKSVMALKKRSYFNVLRFSDRLIFLHDKGIVPASSAWKRKATKWVGQLTANGMTHTDKAMKKAFEDKRIDTIVLLTDGAPFYDRNTDQRALMAQIVNDVAKMNKLRKLKIYTFGFVGPGKAPPNQRGGGGGDSKPLVDFLKKLAEDNGGTFTEIK